MTSAPSEVGAAVLAHEKSFYLGDIHVEPGLRRATRPDGTSTTVEPLVMQVLVVLAKAGGTSISRSSLIERCWSQRVVGDDSVSRVIFRLRKLATEFALGAFSIETIPKVGFRLVVANANNRLVSAEAPTSRLLARRGVITGAAAVGIGLLGAGTVLWPSKTRDAPLPEAMLLYRRGMENRGQASLLLTEQAGFYFREAVRIDPNFAEGWAALAWTYRGLLAYGNRPDARSIEAKCRSAARRALELDPQNIEAQSALLLLKPFYQRWLEVESGCRKLLLRDPLNSILQYNFASVLTGVGRLREALPFLKTVAERERFWPLPSYNLAQTLIAAGQIEEAEDVLERSTARWPRRTDFWLTRHRLLIADGRASEALSFGYDLSKRPIADEDFIRIELLGSAAVGGSESGIRAASAQILDFVTKRPTHFPYGIVSIIMLGQLDTAFEMLSGFYFGRGRWASVRSERPETAFLFGGLTKALRDHPRFARLTDEMGLERYWRAAVQHPDYRRG